MNDAIDHIGLSALGATVSRAADSLAETAAQLLAQAAPGSLDAELEIIEALQAALAQMATTMQLWSTESAHDAQRLRELADDLDAAGLRLLPGGGIAAVEGPSRIDPAVRERVERRLTPKVTLARQASGRHRHLALASTNASTQALRALSERARSGPAAN